MEHKIIHTENYLLVVDETDIEDYDYTKFDVQDFSTCLWRLKAHLPLNNSPILEGVDLLPPLEDEVEKMAQEYLTHWRALNNIHLSNVIHAERCKNDFKAGYKKAKETYKYTEKDMRKAIQMAWEADSIDGTVDLNVVLHYGNNNDLRTKWSENEIIQSLQQPKLPIAFVLSDKFSTFAENVKNGKYIYE